MPVFVTLFNMGTDTLRSLSVRWEANGVSQPAANWNGSLVSGDSEVVKIGTFIADSNKVAYLRAWIVCPNNMHDANPDNDTARFSRYTCAGPLAGTYTVGEYNSDFSSLDEAFTALNNCTVSGAVEMRIRPGTFTVLQMSGSFPGSSATNTVTFTADSGNVIFDDSPGLELNDASYMTFRDLTFGNLEKGSCGVKMSGCTGIKVEKCRIYACTTATTQSYSALKYSNESGVSVYPKDIYLSLIHI